MILIKISDSYWIELTPEQLISIYFGQITIRMNLDDFHTMASMFDLSMGNDMPDEKICSVYLQEDGNYKVTYRAFSMSLCQYALNRFAELCAMGVMQLEYHNKQNKQKHFKTAKKWRHLSVVPSSR